MIIEDSLDRVGIMRKLSLKIQNDTYELRNTSKSPEIASFSIIQGRYNVYSKISKMIEKAQNNIYIVTTIEDIARMYHTTIPEKIMMRQDQIDIRLITRAENQDQDALINRFGIKNVRVGKIPANNRTVIRDQSELLMSDAIDSHNMVDGDNDTVMHTDSNEITASLYNFYLMMWSKFKPGVDKQIGSARHSRVFQNSYN